MTFHLQPWLLEWFQLVKIVNIPPVFYGPDGSGENDRTNSGETEMKKSMKMFAGLALAASFGSSAIAADAIRFDPDGAGGDPAINNVLAFDWAPGNVLAVGGNAAVQNFINSATANGNAVTIGNNTIFGTQIGNNTPTQQDVYSVYYQAKLAGFQLVGGDPQNPVTSAGLNSTYEITAVARFDERIDSILFNNTTGTAQVNFEFVPSATQYLEIYHGGGANFNVNELAGTGFNDGTLILEASLISNNFLSAFSALRGSGQVAVTELLDQAGLDDYNGQLTIRGGGNIDFNADIDSFDSTFFVDVLSAIDFKSNTTGNLKLPFEQQEPGAAFLVDADGTALGAIPVSAGIGNPLDPIVGIGTVNGGLASEGGGNSIQFQADVSTSFQRVPGVVPEPATAALGLMALAGLALRGRRRQNV